MRQYSVMNFISSLLHAIGWSLFYGLLIISSLWVSGAFWFQLPLAGVIKLIVIVLWWLLSITVLSLVKPVWFLHTAIARLHQRFNLSQTTRYGSVLVYCLSLVAVMTWWHHLMPEQNRNWAPDVAHLLKVEQQGTQVTLHNVRNFDWHTETQFTPHWETRQYDISQLSSLDVITSYWMGPQLAHVLVSFGFSNGQYLTFSVETRREQHEQFSTLGGFFKMYELSLIAADERDIIYTRTNVRGEKVYLYRVNVSKPTIQRLFNAYLNEARQLAQQPRFYNSLTSNCTTIVFHMAKIINPALLTDYRIVLSGYLPQYIYDNKGLDQSVPFQTLQQKALINPYGTSAESSAVSFTETPVQATTVIPSSADYSKAIRTGLSQ